MSAEFDPAAVAIRPAATVMLVRDAPTAGDAPIAGGGTSLEVFMLRRTTKAAFASGMYVFPGGAVDLADDTAEAAALCDGLDDGTASRRLGIADGGLAYWIAAIRECFEEAGVLLARTVGGATVRFDDADVGERFEGHRRRVHAGELGIVALCEQEGLRLTTDDIEYVSHWVTPFGEVRRFDTRFFVAAAPADQEPLHDEHETVESMWVSPQEALERARDGHLLMLPPTTSNLEFLAACTTVDEVMAEARRIGRVERVLPKAVFREDGRMIALLMPGDPGYDDIPDR